MADPITSGMLSPLHASAAMRSIMSDRARLQRMLDFEASLARAEGAVGIFSAVGALDICEACRAERYDLSELVETARPSGDLAAALVEALIREVTQRNKQAANFVNWGAASQDVIDTALMLELRAAIDLLVTDLETAMNGFTALAGRHRRTMAVSRTMLQQAQPLPFGLRVAGYAAALARSRERLLRLRREALVLQFGGTAGTLSTLGEQGMAVAERLAALLDLQLPEAPWHSHRDRLADIAASFAILAGTCGKIARDVAVLMQIEIGEAAVAATHATGSAAALSAAAMAPNLAATILAAQVQEHEGGLAGAPVEWMTFPTLALVTSGALDAVVRIAEGLQIDADRMRANLDRTGGRIMAEAVSFALAEKLGHAEALNLVRELAGRDEDGKTLRDVLIADPRITAHLTSAEIEKLFQPLTYLGSAQVFIDRLVYAAQPRTLRRLPETKLPAAPQLSPIIKAEPAAPEDGTEATESREQAAAAAPMMPEPSAFALEEPGVPQAAASSSEPFPAESPSPPSPTSPPSEAERPAPASTTWSVPEALPTSPPPEEDAPGAFMDVLFRAEAEEKRKRH